MDPSRLDFTEGGERWLAPQQEFPSRASPASLKRKRPDFNLDSGSDSDLAPLPPPPKALVQEPAVADNRCNSFSMLMKLVGSYQCAVDGYKIFEMNPFRGMTGMESLNDLCKHYGEGRVLFLLSVINYYQDLLEQHLASQSSGAPSALTPSKKLEGGVQVISSCLRGVRDDLSKLKQRIETLETTRSGSGMSI